MTLAKSCIVMQRYITSVVDGSCKKCKTINSRYSLVVTHPTTNLPAHGLSTAERTGSPVFHVLWSIAKDVFDKANIFRATLDINDRMSAQELLVCTLFSIESVVDSEKDQLHDGLTGQWAAREQVGEKQVVHH
jgi:hypothetical protein